VPQNNRRVKRREVVTRRESRHNLDMFLKRAQREAQDIMHNCLIRDPVVTAEIMQRCQYTQVLLLKAYDDATEELRQQREARKRRRSDSNSGSNSDSSASA